jgi:hypothetical protein
MKNLVTTLCALLSFFGAVQVLGSDPVKPAKVCGKVIDRLSGEELTGARVEIRELGMVAFTDRNGEFSFSEPVSCPVTLSISLVSFDRAEMNIQPASLIQPLEIALSER